jgi:hypothetical protein
VYFLNWTLEGMVLKKMVDSNLSVVTVQKHIITTTFYYKCEIIEDSRTTSAYDLAHEQLHFDIGELYARKIRKGVMELRDRKIKSIEEYGSLISKLITERETIKDNKWEFIYSCHS